MTEESALETTETTAEQETAFTEGNNDQSMLQQNNSHLHKAQRHKFLSKLAYSGHWTSNT